MTKIEALEKTIYNLENDKVTYCWHSSETCNCGVLAHTIIGKSPSMAGYHEAPFIDAPGIFARAALCMNTGLPLPEVFQALKDTGFTQFELLELEYLSNSEIASKTGRRLLKDERGMAFDSELGYSDKYILINYLKAWVEILKESQPAKHESRPDITKELAKESVEERLDIVPVKQLL